MQKYLSNIYEAKKKKHETLRKSNMKKEPYRSNYEQLMNYDI